MEPIYYYKTASDIWHFSTGESLPALKGNELQRKLRNSGKRVIRLYLNVPEHFEIIKSIYKTPDYWRNRTWQDEYEEED